MNMFDPETGRPVSATEFVRSVVTTVPEVLPSLLEAERARGEEHALVISFPTAGKADDFMGAVPLRVVRTRLPVAPDKPAAARHVVLIWPKSPEVPDGHSLATWIALPMSAPAGGLSSDLRCEEVSVLSWPSRIALAVRCAQRVVSLFEDDPSAPGETRTLEAGVRGAMRVACDRISLGTEHEARLGNRITDLARATEATAKKVRDQHGPPAAAPETVISPANAMALTAATVEAAVRAAWAYDAATPEQVVRAATYARTVVGAVTLIGRGLNGSPDAIMLSEDAARVANEAVRADAAWLGERVYSTNAVPEAFFERPLWPSASPFEAGVIDAYRAAARRLRSDMRT
ncbi:MAG: hypothetical protein KIT58_03800 [Planctomycetota bacterium]|nr:hypothetical protein [Planctomycetota bacterium]